jgi:hypothetical protein
MERIGVRLVAVGRAVAKNDDMAALLERGSNRLRVLRVNPGRECDERSKQC